MAISQDDFLKPEVGEVLTRVNQHILPLLVQWGARPVVIAFMGQAAMGSMRSGREFALTREEFIAAAALAYDNARMVCHLGESLVDDSGRN